MNMNLNFEDARELLELEASLEIDIERCSYEELEKLAFSVGDNNSLIFYNCNNTNIVILKKLAAITQGKILFKFK